jgi:hypothetical protein
VHLTFNFSFWHFPKISPSKNLGDFSRTKISSRT